MSNVLANIPSTHLPPLGHYGIAADGVMVRRCDGLELASVVSSAQHMNALRDRCRSAFNLIVASEPKVADGQGLSFVGIGPYRWLGISSEPHLAARLDVLAPCAAVCDQTDAYIVFDVSGTCARAALAKGVNLDLDREAFRCGAAAATSVALISVVVWRVGEDVYRFAVPASFTASFLRFLVASSVEFGCTIA